MNQEERNIEKNHQVRKIQDAIWNCVRLGYIPQHHAVKLTHDFQEYKALE